MDKVRIESFKSSIEYFRSVKYTVKIWYSVELSPMNKPEEHKPWAIINVKEPQYPQYITNIIIKRRVL